MASLLTMPVSLWSLIDSYLVGLTTAWAAKYAELQNAQITVGETYDPANVNLPLILINSNERHMQQAEPMFGDGEYHLDGIVYPYEMVIVGAFATMADAKNFASNASASLTAELASDPTLGGLAAADGEYVKQFELDDGELYIRGQAGQDMNGKFSGAACVRIQVLTER